MRISIPIILISLAMPAMADDLPVFRQGLWEFDRSVDGGDGKPVALTTQKCTDPTADMKKKNEAAGGTCKMSPVARSGNLYTFSAECTILGVSMQSKSVITAESDSAYKVDVEARQDGITTREQLKAKRVGDC
jgi:Protein of unknown function (DUF3617)